MKPVYYFLIEDFKSDLEVVVKKTSVRVVARKAGKDVSPSMVSRICTGRKTGITLRQFLRLCEVMEASPHDYLAKMLF